jgi:3-methyladenine DNA glycosylase AlkD
MTILYDLQKLANKERAAHSARYFKTGKGEYGEGDIFAGLTVPQVREVAKKYKDLPLPDVEDLLHSNIHEYRLTALIILTYKKLSREIVDLYLKNTKHINNWDLVDLSSHEILGTWLLDKPRDILYKLAKSKNIWERRIAIISTFAFLRKKELDDSMKLAELLLRDEHDLMQKAVGWALREVGKRDEKVLVTFLAKHYKTMPRTTLRYAIEKFSPERRRSYLQGTV